MEASPGSSVGVRIFGCAHMVSAMSGRLLFGTNPVWLDLCQTFSMAMAAYRPVMVIFIYRRKMIYSQFSRRHEDEKKLEPSGHIVR